jgi:hypothetical protein
MRMPDFHKDGFSLEDGEEYHRAAPETFLIPDLALRKMLRPGDFAKLIFKIAVDSEQADEAFERMWVVIRERTPTGYIGMLDNEPHDIAENDRFWCGTELPFQFRHIIAVMPANEESVATAWAPVPIPWNPSD